MNHTHQSSQTPPLFHDEPIRARPPAPAAASPLDGPYFVETWPPSPPPHEARGEPRRPHGTFSRFPSVLFVEQYCSIAPTPTRPNGLQTPISRRNRQCHDVAILRIGISHGPINTHRYPPTIEFIRLDPTRPSNKSRHNKKSLDALWKPDLASPARITSILRPLTTTPWGVDPPSSAGSPTRSYPPILMMFDGSPRDASRAFEDIVVEHPAGIGGRAATRPTGTSWLVTAAAASNSPDQAALPGPRAHSTPPLPSNSSGHSGPPGQDGRVTT